MNILLNIIVFFACLFFQFTSAQNDKKLDSLLKINNTQFESIEKANILDKLFYISLENTKSTDALNFAKQELELSKKIKYKIGEGNALHNLGFVYNKLYEFDSARYYFKKANNLWQNIENKEKQLNTMNWWAKVEHLQGNYDLALEMYNKNEKTALALNSGTNLNDVKRNKATIYMDKGSYELALKEFFETLKILDTLSGNNSIRKGDILVGIGRVEFLLENYNSAIISLNEGLEIFEKENNPIWQCITHNEIGLTNFQMKSYDNSFSSFNRSLEIAKKMGRKNFEAICYANLGMVLIKKNDPDKALDYLYKSLSMSNNIASNLSSTYTEIGNALLAKKKFKQAVDNYTYSIKISDSIGAINELRNGYSLRSIAYEKASEFRKALSDQKQFQVLNDSIFNNKKSQQIEELRTIYETEKKEQQIAIQENEIQLLEQKAKVSNLQRLLLGGALLLSLIGFYALRQKMKRNKLEKEKVDAELAYKKKELTTHALHLAKKNEVLEGLKQKAQKLKESEGISSGYQQLIRTINFDLQDDNNWENFAMYFEEVHKNFNSKVKQKYPEVTSNELRLLALLKMNLSSKEIASILNISQEGIKKARYRLRKKLDIASEESLQDLVLNL